jgi:tRNA pseudouridine-54 N-methylase
VSALVGVVRDIIFEVMRRDWEMGGDVGIAVLSGGLCRVDVLCRCGVYTYLRSGVMDPQFAYILYVSGCVCNQRILHTRRR